MSKILDYKLFLEDLDQKEEATTCKWCGASFGYANG